MGRAPARRRKRAADHLPLSFGKVRYNPVRTLTRLLVRRAHRVPYMNSPCGPKGRLGQPPAKDGHNESERPGRTGRFISALALLVLRVLTDNHHAAFPLDDLALFADGLHTGTDLHLVIHSFKTRLKRGTFAPLAGADGSGTGQFLCLQPALSRRKTG